MRLERQAGHHIILEHLLAERSIGDKATFGSAKSSSPICAAKSGKAGSGLDADDFFQICASMRPSRRAIQRAARRSMFNEPKASASARRWIAEAEMPAMARQALDARIEIAAIVDRGLRSPPLASP